MRDSTCSGERGFTLIEVVLALALTIMLLGVTMTFMWELGDRRTRLARATRDLHAGTVIVERIESDLMAGLAGDPGIGGGIQGTATSLRLMSRGVWLADATPGGAGPVGGDASVGDLQGSQYLFDPASGKLTARTFYVKPGGGAGGELGGRDMELVTDRVERVRFRYYDGKAWRSSFDSLKESKLPVAIEVAVWFTSLANASSPGQVVPVSAGGNGSAGSSGPKSGADGPDDLSSPDAKSEVDASGPPDMEKKWPAPDRLRVIIVPDGPRSTWKEDGES